MAILSFGFWRWSTQASTRDKRAAEMEAATKARSRAKLQFERARRVARDPTERLSKYLGSEAMKIPKATAAAGYQRTWARRSHRLCTRIVAFGTVFLVIAENESYVKANL